MKGAKLPHPSMTAADSLTSADFQSAVALRQALQAFTRASERVLRSHGLTSERYQLLLAIKAAELGGAQVTVGDLARSLELAVSTATQLVRRAENLGLVRREHAERDARIRHLRLTGEGERRLAAAVGELREDRGRLLSLLGGDVVVSQSGSAYRDMPPSTK